MYGNQLAMRIMHAWLHNQEVRSSLWGNWYTALGLAHVQTNIPQ